MVLESCVSFVASLDAQRLIAQRIGGMPLGTSFFEDGRTGITATSHLVPFPGYEAERSVDGGYTWTKTPDQDGTNVVSGAHWSLG